MWADWAIEQAKTPAELNKETYDKISKEVGELKDTDGGNNDKIEWLDGKLTSWFFDYLKTPDNKNCLDALFGTATSINLAADDQNKGALDEIIAFLTPITKPINIWDEKVNKADTWTADKFYDGIEQSKTETVNTINTLIGKINNINNPDLAKLKSNLEETNKILSEKTPKKEDVKSLQRFLDKNLEWTNKKNFQDSSFKNNERDWKFWKGTFTALNAFVTDADTKVEWYEKAKTIAAANDAKASAESLGDTPEKKKGTIDTGLNTAIKNWDQYIKWLTFKSSLSTDNRTANIQFSDASNNTVWNNIIVNLDNPKLDALLPIKILDKTLNYKLSIDGNKIDIAKDASKSVDNAAAETALNEAETKNNNNINSLLKASIPGDWESIVINWSRWYKYWFDEKQKDEKWVDWSYKKTLKIDKEDYPISFKMVWDKPKLVNNVINLKNNQQTALLKIDNGKFQVMIDNNADIEKKPEYKKLTTNEVTNWNKTLIYPKNDANLWKMLMWDDGKISYTWWDNQSEDLDWSKDLRETNPWEKSLIKDESIINWLNEKSLWNKFFSENKDVISAIGKWWTDIKDQLNTQIKKSLSESGYWSKNIQKIGNDFYYYDVKTEAAPAYEQWAEWKQTLELKSASKDIADLNKKVNDEMDKKIADLQDEIKPIKETYDKILKYQTDKQSWTQMVFLEWFQNNLKINLNLKEWQKLFEDSKIKDRKVDFIFDNVLWQNITFGKNWRFEKAEAVISSEAKPLAKFDDVENKLIFW